MSINNWTDNLKYRHILIPGLVLILTGCVANNNDMSGIAVDKLARTDSSKLLPVDCLLPAQVRRLGSKMNYLAPRSAIKTTAAECEIRGGEYVAYDRADYRSALNVWLEKAKQGDAEGQTYVGEIYEKGLGLPADYQTAFSWYSKAAEQGYSRAQINLGYLYEKGLGVKKDMLQALNWYRRASGVEGDDLDYSSAIEVKATTLAQEKTVILRQEIKRRETQIKNLTVSLKSARQQIKQEGKQLKDAREKLKELEQQQKNTSDETVRSNLQSSIASQKQKIKLAESALSNLESTISQDDRLVGQKTTDVELQKQQLASISPAGPSIEIIDPAIFVTRSGELSVRIRSGNSTRVIRGKIEAAAGLKKAMLNNRPLSIDSKGIFHSAVTISNQPKTVSIEALDNLGVKTEYSFRLIPKGGSNSPGIDENRLGRVSQGVDFGRYFALVIGNNEYENFPSLKTAVTDAEQIAQVLKTKYGFDTRLITNADRYTILSAMNEIKSKMSAKDNLIVYYAGHGERDATTLQGYWLPVDAEQENTANWIPNSAVSGLLNTMSANHILVIADSCYSGSMTRSSVARLDAQLNDQQLKKWLKVMNKTSSRTVLTSGGIQPVLDGGGGEHSIFAQSLLKELTMAQGPIDAYKVYLKVSSEVQQKSSSLGFDQVPTYAPIQHTGHGGGEFIFVKG